MTIGKKAFTSLTARYIVTIVLAGALTYYNALNAGFLSIDDIGILDRLQSSSMTYKDIFFSGGGIYFRPLIAVSYLFDLYLFGRNPVAFHVINIIIHLINGLLIYYLVLELFKDNVDRDKFSLLSALIFVLYPLNSEAVIWMAARTDSLCCLFSLLTLILLLKKERNPDILAMAGLFFMFLFSLFAKEASFGLLLAVPLYLVFKKDATNIPLRNKVLLTAPLFFSTVVYLFLRSGKIGVVDTGIGKVLTGLQQATPLSISDFVLAYGYYLGKLIYPFPLNFAIVEINPQLSLAALFIFIPICIALFLRDQNIRLPILIFITGIFAPILALLAKLPWTPYAERYLYVPMAGFSIFAAIVLITYLSRIYYSVLVTLVLLLAIPTINRVNVWTAPVSFWQDATVKSPNFHRAHIGYAASLIEAARYSEAEYHLNKAAALGFDKDFLWLNYAALYYRQQDYHKYEQMMAKAASVSSDSTQIYINLIGNLTKIYGSNRQTAYKKLINYYIMAHEKDPTYTEGLYNAGKLYWIMNDKKNAQYYLGEFIRQEKDSMYKPFAEKILTKIAVS